MHASAKHTAIGNLVFTSFALPLLCFQLGYSKPIPTNGLVAYFPFNGDANDTSGNGLRALAYGTTFASDRFGHASSAYAFDRTNGSPNTTYVSTTGNFSIQGNNSRTVSVWFCLDEISPRNYGNLVSWGSEGVGNCFHVTYEPWQELEYRFAIDGGSIKWAWLYNGNLTTGVWYHLLVTYANNLGNSKMYLNGTPLVGVSDPRFGNAASTLNTGAGPLRINSYMNEGWGIIGKMDDVRIYNRELSSTEALDIYNIEKGSTSYTTKRQDEIVAPQQLSTQKEPTQTAYSFLTIYVGGLLLLIASYFVYRKRKQIIASGPTLALETTPKDETLCNTMKSLRKIEGLGKTLEVYEDKLTITPTGILGFFDSVTKGGVTIPIASITAIQFKEGGMMRHGYMQFTILGGMGLAASIDDAAKDANGFTFPSEMNSQALEIKSFIENAMSKTRNVERHSPASNVSEEIGRLAELHSKGILTNDEFSLAKAKLLSAK